MKFFIKFISVILVIIFIVWGIPIIKCEYLTVRYGGEFDLNEPCEENSLIPKTQSFKVMSYGKEKAKLYCIGENYSMGNILVYKKTGNKWEYDSWDTLWTAMGGNADNDVWPYFWHNTKYARKYRAKVNESESFFMNFKVEKDKVYIE